MSINARAFRMRYWSAGDHLAAALAVEQSRLRPSLQAEGRTDVHVIVPTRSKEPHDVSRWLIVLGLVLIVVGILWPLLSKLGLGRLPGDIVIERESFQFYFPIMTSLLVSLLLSVILWLIDR